MVTPTINYFAVLAAAAINMVIGSFWYSPVLFAKTWMKALGKKKEQLGSPIKAMSISAVCALITAYVLAHFANYTGATTVADGAVLGFWAWLGFVATITLSGYLFENRPIKLYLIYAGYTLVSLIAMGAVIAVWK